MASFTLRGDLVNLHAGLGHGRQGRSPGLSHDEGGLEILGEEQTFAGAKGRRMVPEHLGQDSLDLAQASGAFPGLGAADGPGLEEYRASGADPDHAPTGAAQRGIDAQHP